jgi:hypothetical protein
MSKQKHAPRLTGSGLRAKPRLQRIAKIALAVQFDASLKLSGAGRNQGNTGVHSSLHVRRRLLSHQLPRETNQRLLLAPRSSKQGAHGNLGFGVIRHLMNLSCNHC